MRATLVIKELTNNELAQLGYRVERLAVEGSYSVLRNGNLAVHADGRQVTFESEHEAAEAVRTFARNDRVSL